MGFPSKRFAILGAFLVFEAVLAPGRQAVAAGDPLAIRYVTRVSEGERPKVLFEARAALGKLTVELTRDDGLAFSATWDSVAAGQARELDLGGDPGQHHYAGRFVLVQGGASQER